MTGGADQPDCRGLPDGRQERRHELAALLLLLGHVALVLLSTLFFAAFGTANWRVLTLLWMIVPIANAVYFSFVPLYPIVPEEAQQMPMKRMLTSRVFWLLMVMMVCAGASEQAMSQWASTFAEDGLHITKTMGICSARARSPSRWARRAPCMASLRINCR